MIFKTTLKDINAVAIAIDKLGKITSANMSKNTIEYSLYGKAIEGLSAKQLALVLSTQKLTPLQIEQIIKENDLIKTYGVEVLVKEGLISANSALLTSEKAVYVQDLQQDILKSALNKEAAKEFIQKHLTVAANGEETASTILLNEALLDEAVSKGILSKEKAVEILSTYGVVTADLTEIGSKKGLTKATKELIASKITLSATDIAMIAGVAALIFTIYKCNKAVKEARERAQELGDSFKETSSTIEDYKSKIEELYKVINDENSSIEDTTNARKSLLSIQDELIDKFGTEESVINNVTDAINGQTEALDKLSKVKWQKAKNDFTHGGFWNDIANFFQGTDNIERMLDEYGEKTILIKWADYADINKLTDEMVAEFENIGIDIKVSTDNLQAVRDFDSLTESIEDTKGASLSLSGNAEEIYNKLLALQNLVGNDDSFDKLYDKVGNVADSYKELTEKYKNFYDQYILQEKIFADDSKYADTFKNITDAAEKYNEAFTSGDETKIKEAADEYADLVSTAMATAIANGDSDVATYFENMYPTLKSIVDGWNFNIAFDANTDDLQGKVQNVLDELKDENGRSITTEEILGLGESNAQYQALVAIAHTYNMTIEEMIELLKKRNLVSNMDYQGLVGLFGQDNVNKLSPEDLEIAYTIKNVGNMTFEQLQEEIQRAKEVSNEPLSFSTQLLSSQESLDKFQSSVKSASDAYATLLSGSYSSSDLLDSIQEINQAISDMGGSLNWEFINSQSNSLELLGNAIDHISEKYAESILSDMGIDTDSSFGRMLAENIIQAQKAATQLDVLNGQIDSLQSSYTNLTDIVDTYNQYGYITFDQLQNLLAMEPQYLACLIDENGQLQLNQQALQNLAEMRLYDAKVQAVNQAISELGALTHYDEKKAVEDNAQAFRNSVEDISAYNDELADTIMEAGLAAPLIRDLNTAITGAEERGASDTDIQTVLDNLNAKMKLIGSVANGGLGNILGASSSASKQAETDWKALLDKETNLLEKQLAANVITFREYTDKRRQIIEDYYRDGRIKAEEYCDALESMYANQLSLHDRAVNAVTGRLDEEIDRLKEQKEALESSYQVRIDAIQEEIDALNKANDARKEQIDLEKAQYEAERARKQRVNRSFDGSQFIYEADAEAVRDAEDDLADKEFQLNISRLETQIESLKAEMENAAKSLDIQIEALESYKEKWNEIADSYGEQQDKLIAAEIMGTEWERDILNGRLDTLRSFTEQYIALQQAQADAAVNAARIKAEAGNGNTAGGNVGSVNTVGNVGNAGTGGNGNDDDDTQKYDVVYEGTAKAVRTFNTPEEAQSYANYMNKVHYKDDFMYYVKKYASGTNHAKKGLNLVGEEGTETFIDNDGNISLVTKPTLIPMEGGEEVKDAEETKALLDKSNLFDTSVSVSSEPNEKMKSLLKRMQNVSLSDFRFQSIITPLETAISFPHIDLSPVLSSSTPVNIVQNNTINCPNVTNNSGAEYIMKELKRLPLDAIQFSHRRYK